MTSNADIPKSMCGRCDSYGVVPNRTTGLIEKCPDCDGRRLTNDEVRHAHALSTTHGDADAS